jgi:hypothetical protein
MFGMLSHHLFVGSEDAVDFALGDVTVQLLNLQAQIVQYAAR